VKVGGGGDEGPYTYDHMLKVTFHTDGHAQPEIARYYTVPDYGGEISITDNVYVTRDTTEVWVEMDVLTCLTNPCDLTTTVTQRFQIDQPGSHRATNSGLQGDMWSKPGQYGSNGTTTSQRRPLLEDSNWCNNVMSSSATADICNHANQPADEFIATNQSLPIIVGQIGASAVPSFAPSMMAVALAGLFVTALSFTSRRDEDEEDVQKQTMADDEGAVSPVIATILMVAITVVLSGVIYVWASSLADTDVKGTPRVTFKIEEYDATNAETGHWRITIGQSETDLATQAVQVRIIYTNATGATVTKTFSLSDSNGVYGYNPENSDAFVMFVDSTLRKEGTNYKSTFSAGDTIFVRTHDPEGTPLEKATVSITYAPAIAGQSTTVLKTYEDLSYNKAP
jgi:flagellin-like protein